MTNATGILHKTAVAYGVDLEVHKMTYKNSAPLSVKLYDKVKDHITYEVCNLHEGGGWAPDYHIIIKDLDFWVGPFASDHNEPNLLTVCHWLADDSYDELSFMIPEFFSLIGTDVYKIYEAGCFSCLKQLYKKMFYKIYEDVKTNKLGTKINKDEH